MRRATKSGPRASAGAVGAAEGGDQRPARQRRRLGYDCMSKSVQSAFR